MRIKCGRIYDLTNKKKASTRPHILIIVGTFVMEIVDNCVRTLGAGLEQIFKFDESEKVLEVRG